MTQVHWLRAVNGVFNTAANWSTDTVPSSSNDAILDASGSAYTVSATQDATVSSIQTASGALLDIQASFSATSGTGTGANNGAIRIENGHTLNLQGTVANVGTMELLGTVSTTSIVLGPGGVTLTGGGPIFLNFTGGALQQIVPAAGGSVLTDVNDRISGKGLLGGPGLTIISQAAGFLEAKGGALIIDTGAHTIINAGLIDAEGQPSSGGLPPGLGTVESPVDNSGIVKADGVGSIMTFEDAVTGTGRGIISGGTLRFDSAFNQDVAFEATTGVLYLAQSVNYTSRIQQFATTGAESLDLGDIGFVGAGEATYSGVASGGVLTVTDGVHTAHIHFEGDYTGEASIASSDGHGGTSVTTNGPTALHWLNPVNGLFQTAADWTGGVAPGAGNDAILDAPGTTDYTVTASANTTVSSIQLASTALLDITANFSATSGTGTGANDGAIRIENGHTLTLQGTVANAGSIELFGTVSTTSIVLGAGGVTLEGGGAIFLNFTGGALQRIVPSASGSVLTDVDNRISGQGLLGGPGLTIIVEAQGFLEAKAGPLIIDTGAHTLVNAGLIDAEGAPGSDGLPPGLGTVKSPVNNSGILEAGGDGSIMTFQGAVTGTGRAIIAGGTLSFRSAFNQNVAFETTTGVLALAQSVNYTGLISGFSTNGAESFDLGDIGFVGAGEATYSGTTTSGTLTVTDGTHTARIRLQGNYLGAAFVAKSNGAGGTSVTDSSKALHWVNAVNGLFQTAANWTGGVVPGPSNDAILDAPAAHYAVTTSASQTVAGIQTAANAILSVTGAFLATKGSDGGASAGRIAIANGGTFTAGGTLNNTGLVTMAASSGVAKLVVAGALTLTGGGYVLMGNSASNVVVGSSPAAILTNVNDIIGGVGDLGDGQLTLVNQAGGEIASSQSSAPLIIDTGANTIVNGGLIEAAGAGATIVSPVANAGYLKADGGDLTVDGAVSGAGLGIVAGGTLRFNSTFSQEVAFQGGAGVLFLARSASYTGLIAGFSTAGTQSLDLGDIGFVGAGEATYSGTTSGGVLTVTDGTHTAHIHFQGNYTASAFIAKSDGHGGTSVTDPMMTPARGPAAVHAFVAAMARHGVEKAGSILAATVERSAPPLTLAASPIP